MADKSLIPGFDPNRENNYTLKPDTPAKPGGAAGGGASTGASPGFFSDFATVAGSHQPYKEAYSRATGQQTPGDLVSMRAAVEDARQRLGPVAAKGADFAGTIVNPANVLSRVPYVGPGLAGAAQSAFEDYGQGKDWPTIGKDAALGFGVGEASLGLVQPSVAKNAIARLTDIGGGMTAGALLGHNWGSEYTVPGMLGAGAALHNVGDWLGERAGNALNNPYTRRAVQQLLYGAALPVKPESMPPLPGFATMGN